MRLTAVGLIALPVVVGGLGVAAAVVALNPPESSVRSPHDVSVERVPDGPDVAEADGGTAIEGTRPHLTVRDGASAISLPGSIRGLLSLLPPTTSAALPPLRADTSEPVTPATRPGGSAPGQVAPPPTAGPKIVSPAAGDVRPGFPAGAHPRPADTPVPDIPSRSTVLKDSPSRPDTVDRPAPGQPMVEEEKSPLRGGGDGPRGDGPPLHAGETGRPDHAGTTGPPPHASDGGRDNVSRPDDRSTPR